MRTTSAAALAICAIAAGCARHNGASTSTSGPTNPSSNALLSALSMSDAQLDRAFDPQSFFYGATAPFSSQNTTVTPTAQDPAATIVIRGAQVVSGQPSQAWPLAQGTTRFDVQVTAEDGVTQQTYSVDVVRQPPGGTGSSGIEYVKPDLPGAFDQFGSAMAISGNTMVVGAPAESSCATGVNGDVTDNGCPNSGAAYVFVYDPATGWTQQAYLKASNTDAGDRFGTQVAIDGDIAAISAPFEDSCSSDPSDNSCADAGAVYLFRRNGTTWSQIGYVKGAGIDAGDEFGAALALDGSTLAVGAPGDDASGRGIGADPADNGSVDSGAVHLFAVTSTGPALVAYIKSSNSDLGDEFGKALALHGDRLLVGAPNEGSAPTAGPMDNSIDRAGAAYVFDRSGGILSEVAILKAHNAGPIDRLGYRVALDGDTAVAAGPFEDSSDVLVGGAGNDDNTFDSGAIYTFEAAAGWQETNYVKALNPDPDDCIGIGLAAENGALLGGAPKEASAASGLDGDATDNSLPGAGAAYLYLRDGANLDFAHYVKAPNPDPNDRFGITCALANGVLFVGASGEASDGSSPQDNSAPFAGAVYVYR